MKPKHHTVTLIPSTIQSRAVVTRFNLSRYLTYSTAMTEAEHADFKLINHDDVIKWKHFLRYWHFVRGIHRSPVNSPHTKASEAEFGVFFDLRLNKRLSKQS